MKHFRTIAPSMFIAFTLAVRTIAAQDLPSSAPDLRTASEPSSVAVHLIGLPDVPFSANGSLKLTQQGLAFTSNQTESDITYRQISAVSVGVDRTEAGGKAGSVVRKLPYGAGPLFALASKRQEDLLTVEYRDIRGGYHGAVFSLPFKSAAALQSSIAEHITPLTPVVETSCSTPHRNSILIAPIRVQGAELPAEYRVLLYEQAQHALSVADTKNSYLRSGDSAAAEGCAPFTLHIDVLGFAKGNQSVRAATGPLGFFIDATSVTYHVTLDGPNGKVLLDQQTKKSKRGDTDSLKLAQDIGKDVSKRVDKVMGQKQGGAQQAVEASAASAASQTS
jgi:hypothetical protein